MADDSGFVVDDEVLVFDDVSGASAFAHIIGLGPLQVADSVEMPSGSSVHRVPHIRIVSRTPPTAPVEAEARIRVDGALGGTASPEAYLGRE